MKRRLPLALLAGLTGLFAITAPPFAPSVRADDNDGTPPAPLAEAAAAPAPVALKPGTPEEIRRLLTTAPKAEDHPNAAKATLLDLSDITIRPDGSSRSTTRMTIKIFNERGRDLESEIRIPYTDAFETVKILRARTIKPDGTVVEVKPADIHDQGLDGGYGTYTDARTKSFSMPAVSNDCIIDYEYETNQKASQMPGQFWTRWYFQSGIDPVVLSRLTITAPKSVKLHERLRNTTVKGTTKDTADGKSIVYTWEQRSPAPVEPEYMMPPTTEVLPQLAVSTVPTWQAIADWYSNLAKGRAAADPTIKERTQALIKGKDTPEEKAKAIFYHVEEQVRYVAKELGIGAYQPRLATETFANQYGDCKDMTMLLVAMLREAGVTAHPVLLHAGSQEKISDDLPSPGAFNHAIAVAEIGGRKYWLDATAQLCAWGEIPGGDRGSEAFVIRDGKGEWEVIPHADPEQNRMDQTVQLTLLPDGSAKGKVTVVGSGDYDMQIRSQLLYTPADRRKKFVEQLAQNLGPNAKVTSFTVSDFRDKDKPVTITYEATFPFWANRSGEMLFFKAKPEQTTGISSSPFQEEGRVYPVVQQSAALGRSRLEITLPDGYTVLSQPSGAKVSSGLGRYERDVEFKEGKLTVTTVGINHRAEVPPSRYSEVQKYYEDYLRASDEFVLIRKADGSAKVTSAR